MFDSKRAAEYLVVAWCKNWDLGQYLDVIAEESVRHDLKDRLSGLVDAYPWLPISYPAYAKPVRDFIAGAYPKLSEWMWEQPTDVARLRCAAQIERLKCRGVKRGYVNSEDRAEMKAARRDAYAEIGAYRLSRDAFKSNQRSAWNVCKA